MQDTFFRTVKEHAGRYPKMEMQDYGKLAFQSEYGPEHLLTEKQSALRFLQEEMAELPSDASPKNAEPIGGGLCRFPLSFCKSEPDLESLAELLFLTAQEHCGTVKGIMDKAAQLRRLNIPGMEAWLSGWEEKGYPPVHHSKSYREAYHPHYRLIKREYAGYFPAITAVRKLMEKGETVILGIDGRCGSGKTGLAGLFSRLFDCNVFHMDDFYLPFEKRSPNWKDTPGGNIDFGRLTREVLDPVQKKRTVIYRPYHCGKGQITGSFPIAPKALNIVEGSYSHHPLLFGSCQFKLFLTCSKEEQKRRLQRREGSYYPAFEKQWMPFEEQYYQCYGVDKTADLIVDTSGFFT